MVRQHPQLGRKGFRCDAANKVAAAVWRYLVEEAMTVDAEAMV